MPNYGVVIKIKEAKPKMSEKKPTKENMKIEGRTASVKNAQANAHTTQPSIERVRERERNREENERKKIAYSTNSKRTIMHTHTCTHIHIDNGHTTANGVTTKKTTNKQQ